MWRKYSLLCLCFCFLNQLNGFAYKIMCLLCLQLAMDCWSTLCSRDYEDLMIILLLTCDPFILLSVEGGAKEHTHIAILHQVRSFNQHLEEMACWNSTLFKCRFFSDNLLDGRLHIYAWFFFSHIYSPIAAVICL